MANHESKNTTLTDPIESKSDAESVEQHVAAGSIDLEYLKELLETNYTIEAKTLLRSFLASPERRVDNLFEAAELFMKYKVTDIAEIAYRAILEIDSHNVSVLGRLGDLMQKRGDNYASVNFYRQIIKNEDAPEDWVYIGIGNALEAIGDVQEAIGYFKKAMATSEYRREISQRIEALMKKQTNLPPVKLFDAEELKDSREMDKGGMRRELTDFALGYLEAAATSTLTGECVVVGWIKNAPDVVVWLENKDSEKISLNNAFRFNRQDVDEAYGNTFGYIRGDAGFIIRIAGIKPSEYVRIVASYGDRTVTLSETQSKPIGETAISAARWLFGLISPMSQMPKRLQAIDIPIIDSFLKYEHEIHQGLNVQEHQLGVPISDPVVSVITPLYGRVDFVESQMVEFSRDPWLLENAEIIYVLDDPKLVEGFFAMAENLYRIYRVPFKWVWGSVNRGFSGANNLGADYAIGRYLLFLNSDVFPQKPGWLTELLDVLETNPNVGAVAPRLVFASGSIQHAKISFMRREELGIWVNHHPYMGLDPNLDPAQKLTMVPAVTGACLAMRRKDFDRVGGWDTGYLIGDFEDSDLCLKLQSEGFDIAYLPTVQLTHLERQSFKLLGQGDFRFRVVIYNAVRHQNRWQPLIEKLANNND